MMGFGLSNQEETHRREFESPPGYQQLGLDPRSPMAASRGILQEVNFLHAKTVSSFGLGELHVWPARLGSSALVGPISYV